MRISIPTKAVRTLLKSGADNIRLFRLCGLRALANDPDQTLNLARLKTEDLKAMIAMLTEAGLTEVAANVKGHVAIIAKQNSAAKVDTLKLLPDAFMAAFRAAKNPWVFSTDTANHPATALLVLKSDYSPPGRGRHEEEYVTLTLGYNAGFDYHEVTLRFNKSVLPSSVERLLAIDGYTLGTPELMEQYNRLHAKYEGFLDRQHEQVLVRRKAATELNDFWWNSTQVNLTAGGYYTKAVVCLDPGVFANRGRKVIRGRNYSNDSSDDSQHETKHTVVMGKEAPVPVHMVLPVFSLHTKHFVWVNINNVRDYEFETDLKDKLVLPATHSRLIDALVGHLDVIRESANEGSKANRSNTLAAKARSVIIIARGLPGTGKTLTAEVYAEYIKRPLYEIQAADLGEDAGSVEENLAAALELSSTMRMPLVINEADVFIAPRGDDLSHNAVVAVFLRLLEYHDGLVFLTTNRNEIDDAMVSRAVAIIDYKAPTGNDLLRLWQVQLKEFGLKLPKSDLDTLMRRLPEIVGRDIQNLIRLTRDVATASGLEFNAELMIENSVFRGLKLVD